MSFLAPLFLLGGLLVALPIVLHLTRRRREPIPFPSFLLLRATAATARWKRRRFRHIPLLILRCLALALIAAAFARPLMERDETDPASAAAPLDLAVLLDRSASMAIPGRMDAARAAALEELGALGRGDRALVASFADRAVGLSELTEDIDALRAEVDRIVPGDGATRFSAALGLAGRLLPATRGRRREVVLISDLQRTGFEDGIPSPSLPPGVGLRVRRVGGEPPRNLGVREVQVAADGGDRIAVTASLQVAGVAPEETVEATAELWVAGEAVDRQTVSLAGDRAASVRFASTPAPTEAREAEVRLPEDAFAADNRLRFVIPSEAALPVTDLGDADALHVREALAVGVAPAFAVSSGPLRGESAVGAALGGARAALLRDPGRLDTGGARAVADFVRGGGGVVAAVGSRRIPDAVWAELEGVFPAAVGGVVDREPAGRIGELSRHPVFAPFTGEAASSLSRSAVYRYRALSELAEGVETLARFDDGRPALLSRRTGEGVVLLFASSLDARWNDLPRRPAFVPFLHRMVEVAARHERLPVAYRVGDSVEPVRAFGLSAPDGDAEVLVESPSGERVVIPDAGALRMEEAGFFRGRRTGAVGGAPIAANPAPGEADLRVFDVEEVRLGAAARGVEAGPEGEADAAADAGFLPGTPLWWALLVVLGLLLVVEVMTANRFTPSRARAGRDPGSYTVA